MEPKTSYLYVGLAVLALIAGSVFVALWLTSTRSSEQRDYYTIYFREQTLRGLQKGSAVTMRGIVIGEVESLQILPTDDAGVRVEIAVAADSPILGRCSAVIERNLLTGLATIEITKSGLNNQLAVKMVPGEVYPVIPEGSPRLQVLADSASQILDNLNMTLQEMEDFFDEDKKKSFGRILVNIEKITEALADERGALFDTLRAVSKGVPDLIRLMGMAVASIEQSSMRFSNTLEKYQEPRSLVFGPPVNALGPGEQNEK